MSSQSLVTLLAGFITTVFSKKAVFYRENSLLRKMMIYLGMWLKFLAPVDCEGKKFRDPFTKNVVGNHRSNLSSFHFHLHRVFTPKIISKVYVEHIFFQLKWITNSINNMIYELPAEEKEFFFVFSGSHLGHVCSKSRTLAEPRTLRKFRVDE